MINQLSMVKDPQSFWKLINKFRYRPNQQNSISLNDWCTYLNSIYSSHNDTILNLLDFSDPLFDREISLDEVNASLIKCKKGKAPGLDGITAEFFKNLPDNWIIYMHKLFNKILNDEVVPSNWSEVTAMMLYKKGDKDMPENYRSIALLNVITKIFTQILNKRLLHWADAAQILCEFQSGFRPSRGCLDNIFVLNAIIQMKILAGRKVYAVFIDFRRAFDSVNHTLLWNKLSRFGVSKKFINILRSLYNSAKISVKKSDKISSFVDVERGVLQGEILSPLLFALFLNDIEQYLRSHNCRGVSINNLVDILLLAYADDIVLLTESPHLLMRALKVLRQYCVENFLLLNTTKTKIMVFRAGGRKLPEDTPSFYFGTEELEIVNSYDYLGVYFSSSGYFKAAYNKFKISANTAMGAVTCIINSTNMTNWKDKCKLCDSLLLSVIFHCSEIWALDFLKDFEKIQQKIVLINATFVILFHL